MIELRRTSSLRALRLSLAGLGVALTALVSTAAWAKDLTIGQASEPSAVDPQFSATSINNMTSEHMFDKLVHLDADLKRQPSLALSWTNIDPLNWEIKLRPNVKFHDGSAFTAADVIYSFERAKNVPNSPAPFTSTVSGITQMSAPDPLTLRLTTAEPRPNLIEDIGTVFIVSKTVAANATTDDFNKGKATVGTGPFKFKEWVPGDHLTLVRNDNYWGNKPEFETVTFRYISNKASRVAALLSGSVDMIDQVPVDDLKTLEGKDGIKLFAKPTGRIVYLAVDSGRDVSPFVTDHDGKPMTQNPLKKSKVRQALSSMINRELLVDRILGGSGAPAGQMVPDGVVGHDPMLTPPPFDAKAAKTDLEEAGYPSGFGITVHGSNDRLPQDGDVVQAIGQMFARGGVKVNGVVAQPYNVYASAASKQEFSLFLFSYGAYESNSSSVLNDVLATHDKEKGTGVYNRSRYSNPEFDAVLAKARAEFDPEKQAALLRTATKIAFDDVGLIPLYWMKANWATRGGYVYEPRADEHTLAASVKAGN